MTRPHTPGETPTRRLGCDVAAVGEDLGTAMSRPQAHFGVSAKRPGVRPRPAGGRDGLAR